MFGHPAEMDPIIKVVKRHKLYLIEDAAEAHGATYNNKESGSFGDLACFSFYANKLITTGEGGMVLSNNKKLTKKFDHLEICHLDLIEDFITLRLDTTIDSRICKLQLE